MRELINKALGIAIVVLIAAYTIVGVYGAYRIALNLC